MIWSRVLAVALVCAGIFCLGQSPSARPGPDSNYNINVAAGGAAYTGPGDITPLTFWCGFRAYSNATKATKAIRVVRASDSAQQDINTLSDGTLDASSLTTFLTATTGKVVTCYDKVSTNDATQATDANRPAVTANALGTSYCMTFANGSSTILQTAATYTQSQPYGMLAIANKTAVGASQGVVSVDNGTFRGAEMELTSAPNLRLYSGATLDATATDNAFHALQGVFNGGTSVNRVDVTETSGNAGTQSLVDVLNIGAEGPGSEFLTGIVCEAGYIAATISSGNRTSLNTNMHGAYGGF